MKIGLIGLDTSHSEIFTRLINDSEDAHHVKGAQHSKESVYSLRLWEKEKPYYASLIEQVVRFFEKGIPRYQLKRRRKLFG